MPPLESLASQEAVRASLGAVDWRTIQDRERPRPAGAPQYRDTWVEVRDYRFLGHAAVLRLHFYNDRLWDTRLYPMNQRAALASLQQQGLQLRRHNAGHLLARPTENVMVTAHSDGWGDYISWIDTRLLGQSDDWYRAFGENDLQEGRAAQQ